MFPGRFDYHLPATLDEAVALLGRLGPEAKILAGGASLIPLMKLRLAEPAHLVDLGRVPGLDRIDHEGSMITIGSMVRQSQLAGSPVSRLVPILADTTAVIADPLVRNVGTVGGNLAHGDPANDDPAVMLVLDAVIVALGPGGEREIPAGAFHLDLLSTALAADEVLTAIRIPRPATGTGSAYVKFERQVGDFAIAAAAAVVGLREGRVEHARLAFTNLAPTPVRARGIEDALVGRAPDDETIAAAVAGAGDALDPWDDLRATAAIKRTMAVAAARRALERACERAQWAAA